MTKRKPQSTPLPPLPLAVVLYDPNGRDDSEWIIELVNEDIENWVTWSVIDRRYTTESAANEKARLINNHLDRHGTLPASVVASYKRGFVREEKP